MNNLGTIAIALLLTGFAVTGHAQEMTQSELQSKGATIVAKDELGTLVKGATVYWKSQNGLDNQVKFDEDGSIVGFSKDPSRTGKGVNYTGTWRVAEDGKLCRAQVLKGQTDNYCWVVSKMSDKYYYTVGKGAAVEINIRK